MAPIYQLQNLLHSLLGSFLAFASLTNASLFRRPRRVAYRLGSRSAQVVNLLEEMSCGDQEAVDIWRRTGTCCRADEVARAIAAGYRVLGQGIGAETELMTTVIPDSVQDRPNWEQQIAARQSLRPVRRFCEDLRLHSANFGIMEAWVHGSLATLDDLPGYSDFDALILLDQNTCQCPDSLMKLQSYLAALSVNLYLYDPLQHHGLLVITEIDLRAYPQPYFPLELFRYAVPVTGENVPCVSLRCEKKELESAYLSASETVLRMSGQAVRHLTGYDIKAFLQTVVLLPVLYLQLKQGCYYYKRAGLQEAKRDFTPDEWCAVERATELRNQWKYRSVIPENLRNMIGTSINPKLLSNLHRLGSVTSRHTVQRVLGSDYKDRCTELTKAMSGKLIAQGFLENDKE